MACRHQAGGIGEIDKPGIRRNSLYGGAYSSVTGTVRNAIAARRPCRFLTGQAMSIAIRSSRARVDMPPTRMLFSTT